MQEALEEDMHTYGFSLSNVTKYLFALGLSNGTLRQYESRYLHTTTSSNIFQNQNRASVLS